MSDTTDAQALAAIRAACAKITQATAAISHMKDIDRRAIEAGVDDILIRSERAFSTSDISEKHHHRSRLTGILAKRATGAHGDR